MSIKDHEPDPDNAFSGEWAFLSNFYPSPIVFRRCNYATVEHAYQASKAISVIDHDRIQSAKTPGSAKRIGRSIAMREDWERVKDGIMLACLRLKFAPDTLLAQKLLETENAHLEETNYWGDTYWGVCNGRGKNMLGKLLMLVRSSLRKGEAR